MSQLNNAAAWGCIIAGSPPSQPCRSTACPAPLDSRAIACAIHRASDIPSGQSTETRAPGRRRSPPDAQSTSSLHPVMRQRQSARANVEFLGQIGQTVSPSVSDLASRSESPSETNNMTGRLPQSGISGGDPNAKNRVLPKEASTTILSSDTHQIGLDIDKGQPASANRSSSGLLAFPNEIPNMPMSQQITSNVAFLSTMTNQAASSYGPTQLSLRPSSSTQRVSTFREVPHTSTTIDHDSRRKRTLPMQEITTSTSALQQARRQHVQTPQQNSQFLYSQTAPANQHFLNNLPDLWTYEHTNSAVRPAGRSSNEKPTSASVSHGTAPPLFAQYPYAMPKPDYGSSKRQKPSNNTESRSKGGIWLPPIQAPASVDILSGNQAQVLPHAQASFVYNSLSEHTSGTLRLIQLDPTPGVQFGELCYTMVSFDPWRNIAKHQPSLKDIEYHCLSYCWGDGGKAQQIYLKSSFEPAARYDPLPVTENLYNALKSLSITHRPKWLWIDAISINQKDHQELSSQVSMMKDIYNKAAGVVIWLGESEAAYKAHPIISYISNRFTGDIGLQVSDIIGCEGLMLGPEHLDLLERYTTTNVAGTTPMQAYGYLADFFSLPWFRRVWVLQEAFSRTTITAHMGTLSVHWGSVILAALWQSFLSRSYTAISHQVVSNPRQGPGFLPELWLGLIHNRIPRGLSMTELVLRGRDFLASDPRDKVFGLLGLANDIGPSTDLQNLRPDYTRSKADVYTGFARDIICKTGTLDILSAVDTFSAGPRSEDVASWMPDLDVSIATIRGLGFPPKYNAAFSTKVCMFPTATGNIANPAPLSLSGFIIDTVSLALSPLLTLRKDFHLYMGVLPNAIATLWTTFLSPFYDLSNEQSLFAFIHTITATGFALPTEFPAHPLGQVTPPQYVPSLLADFAAHMFPIQTFAGTFPNPGLLYSLASQGDGDQFALLVGKACHERRFFITKEGRMGLCPRNAMTGDKVVVLYGGSVPYVLRRVGERSWKFIGECYVDGWMFGEAGGARGRRERVFDLV